MNERRKCRECGEMFKARTWSGIALGREMKLTERACSKCRKVFETEGNPIVNRLREDVCRFYAL
jgi:RNA polymerase subunit RPABC4/transcription elongation factor Spt4